jgi:hypothetical protein
MGSGQAYFAMLRIAPVEMTYGLFYTTNQMQREKIKEDTS